MRFFIRHGRLQGQPIYSPMDISIFFLIVFFYGFDDFSRFLGGGRVVEIDDIMKDGEIIPIFC